MRPNIQITDGKEYQLAVNPEADCCVKTIWAAWTCGLKATMVHKITDADHFEATAVKQACFAFSPCPCTQWCGYGPLAASWKWVRDADDEAKWNATGSVFNCGCCVPCTNHNGDSVMYTAPLPAPTLPDRTHDSSSAAPFSSVRYADESVGTSKENPIVLTAGCNPMTPPCFVGKKVIVVWQTGGARGGGPAPETIER